MAARSALYAKPSPRSTAPTSKLFRNPKVSFAFALILADSVLVSLIIAYVPYTKIDWDAYMSQLPIGLFGILAVEVNFGMLTVLLNTCEQIGP